MKTKILIISLLLLLPTFLIAQNKNSLTVKVDGKEFKTEPRRINFKHYVYYTGNISKPETMLRIWLADFTGAPTTKSGRYLVIDNENPLSKKEINEQLLTKKYEGFAFVRYVVETKSPRMAYHVGDSGNKNETITVNKREDGNLELSFNLELNGTYWKEKAGATVFGGLGRLQNKMEDKLISKATGFDWNIDPEGNGYRKQKETDIIKLTDGKMIINLKDKDVSDK
ncbi:MAG TPA: hypothetical protein PKX92_09245 [Edaphocola sp.]|nr:hypothetical protein [Edaphocola sp.]